MLPLRAAAQEDSAPMVTQPSLQKSGLATGRADAHRDVFCYVHRRALSVAAPFMIEELGLSTAVMGGRLSAFFWPYSLLQTPSGWAVDRFGVKQS
jgi:hypothetical protein